jgi:FtsP/CotA-like multicopper oxidase with cupredoxin domain
MMKRKLLALLAVLALCATAAGPVIAKNPPDGSGTGMAPGVAGMPPGMPPMKVFDQSKRVAAAKANAAKGAVTNMAQLAAGTTTKSNRSLAASNPLCPTPSTTVVDYSGTCVPNYANSPLPVVQQTAVVTTVGNPLIARTYASDNTVAGGAPGQGTVLVVLPTALPAGTLQDFQTYVQNAGNPLPSPGNTFNAYVLHPTGNPNEYSIVYDSGPLLVPGAEGVQTVLATGSPAVAAGDLIAFYGQGIPLDVGGGTDTLAYPAPAAPTSPFVVGGAGFPIYSQDRTYSFGADIVTGTTTQVSGGIRKFVDSLPGLGAANANDLGNYIPVAVPDQTTYPDVNSPTGFDDYYEIEVGQYTQQMHKDLLNPTTLRGYRQTNMGGTPFSYLGPAIVAQKDVPVRVKFTNSLPATAGGDLFIPVDTTTMGAGQGPQGGAYSTNRATLHLHGGFTPWISDGTPFQWVTPVGTSEQYPKGVSVSNVPDMPDPGPHSMTFFYTNQQSARLMFYHDHAYGITRLNVYAGEAAPYVLHDPNEKALITNGTLPAAADTVPLVIQDKTFVPNDAQLMAQDPTWRSLPNVGQTEGSLWFPHVYMPNQNPADDSGANAMGRWDFAEWFWPPYTGLLTNGSIPNPLCSDPGSLSCTTMPTVPGTPNPSMVPEGFMDTPLVNGTPYPFVQLQPKAYRFQILNASNDRSLNLSLFYAGTESTAGTFVPCNGATWTGTTLNANGCSGEVPMVPAVKNGVGTAGYTYPDQLDGRDSGVPDSRAAGPSWLQIGTEGGVLPAVVPIAPQPVGYNYNRRDIVVLNVTNHSLLLGPAERADVVVDFSGVPANSTLILYNDSGAPVPAFDPRNDYYTGDEDQTSTGGAPSTLPGYGPNTRTVMQIQIAGATGPGVSPNLAAAVPALYAATQPKPIVGESAYNGIFPSSTWVNQYFRIQDTSKTFVTGSGNTVTNFPIQPKAIQELFETNYGRMNATLGIELPFTNGNNQTTIPLGYAEPVTEIINPSQVGTLIGSTGDGAQVWKITHNGVDTHAIHFHLFDVQLVNRVGWDGAIRPPDANELGWKETIRMNPLEDAIVALRPTVPQLPFGVPDSIRAIDPTLPIGAPIATFNLTNGAPLTVANALFNFGWEYVWHCHLLGHEENDMMRGVKFNAPKALPFVPNPLSYTRTPNLAPVQSVTLTWTDGTPVVLGSLGNPKSEVGFIIERAGQSGPFVQIGTALANQTTFVDTTALSFTTYRYRVTAFNAAGSVASTPLTVDFQPASPANLAATLIAGPKVKLTWTDTSSNETNFVIDRSVDGGATWTLGFATTPANIVTYTDSAVSGAAAPGNTYTYRVWSRNSAGLSAAPASQASITLTVPADPSNFTAVPSLGTGNNRTVTLHWTDNSSNETGFSIQRATNATFTSGLNTATVGANVTTLVQTGLARNTKYYYRIQATNLSGASAAVALTGVFVTTLP